MTPLPRPDDPADREAFETAVSRLVAGADANGVDVRGAYDVRIPRSENPEYTVEISAVEGRFPNPDSGNDGE